MATYKFTRHPPPISIYTRFRVKKSMRAIRSPRVEQAWRTRKLMSLTAFFRNRFYEIDRWYKARIEKAEVYPTCYTIDPDDHYKSLAERIEDLRLEQNEGRELIDIGPAFCPESVSHGGSEEIALSKERENELETLARTRKLYIDPVEVERDSKTEHFRIRLAKSMADHCGIFSDLFHPDAYFYPTVNLHVGYPVNNKLDAVNPVFYGNTLMPAETSKEPDVMYEAEKDTYYTLLLTNPDGCPYENNKEMLHWFVCNIPESRINEGQTLCPYLQPLPFRKTGWHRLVYLLFKQKKYLDSFDAYKINDPAKFPSRIFDTPEFYLKNEDSITPVGLAFFQTAWDKSCTECFHNYLDMEQPIYDFEWPEPRVPPQEEFPSEYKPFNDYLDQYRDYKDIDKEILEKRLKRISPFKAEQPKLKFPNLFFEEDKQTLPSWLHVEKIRENEGYGKYHGLYENELD